jgi:hypothetical protein
VLRCQAFSRVSADSDPARLHELVHRDILPGEIEALKAAVPIYEHMLALPTKAEGVELFRHLTRAMAILGGGWAVAQRKEWIEAVGEVLAGRPWYFVQRAFPDVLRKVSYASEFLRWISDLVDKQIERTEIEHRNLLKTISLLETPLSDG